MVLQTHVLEGLNDFFHVNKLTVIGLVREIHINTPNFVRRHFFRGEEIRRLDIWLNFSVEILVID